MRFLPCGDDGLLVEVDGLDAALALHAALAADPPVGTTGLVPATRTVLLRFDPLTTTADTLTAAVQASSTAGGPGTPGPLVEVPVHYDGEDLVEVARLLGTGPGEVVRRHTAATWTVAFTGFAPGFAYLAGDDPVLDVPRRSSPRTRVPPGAVGLAGRFSGVYPRASPGGWQLLGRTPTTVWDPDRAEPALLRPGMRVRFVEVAATAFPTTPAGAATGLPTRTREPFLEVLAPGVQTLVQDLGRPGRAAEGVPPSGAMDRGALRRANRLVGNPVGAAALEVAAGGLRVRAHGRLVLATAGAPAPATVTAAGDGTRSEAGTPFTAPAGFPFALDDGEVLALGTPSRGVRTVLAVRGGVAVRPVLGSASTDVLSGTGPAPLRAGDRLPVGSGGGAVAVVADPGPLLPGPGDVVVLDVVPGPRDDWFTAESLADLAHRERVVTPRSDRVGLRLSGPPLVRARTGELPSEGTVRGAVQVPPDGFPVVFAVDHPVTGGYPVIACVAAHHLDLLAQLPAGARVRFTLLPHRGES